METKLSIPHFGKVLGEPANDDTALLVITAIDGLTQPMYFSSALRPRPLQEG